MTNNNGHWPYRVDIGDILEDASGNLRTVVKASQGKSGLTTYVCFPILRKSWTGRSHTCVDYQGLSARGFRPTGKRVSRITCLMARVAIDAQTCPSPSHIHAEDVIGVLQ